MDSNNKRKRPEEDGDDGDNYRPRAADDDGDENDDSSDGRTRTVTSSNDKAREGEEGCVSASSVATQVLPIRIPKYKDILLGRGRGIQSSNGNFLMREITKKHRDHYCSLPRTERRVYSEKVLDEILATGARFLKRVDNGDTIGMELWEEVQERNVIHDKVSHSLREKPAPPSPSPKELENPGTPGRMTESGAHQPRGAVVNQMTVQHSMLQAQQQAALLRQQQQQSAAASGFYRNPSQIIAPPFLTVPASHLSAMPVHGGNVYQQAYYGNALLSSLINSAGAANAVNQQQAGAGVFQFVAANNQGAPPINANIYDLLQQFRTTPEQFGATMAANPSLAAPTGPHLFSPAVLQQHHQQQFGLAAGMIPGASLGGLQGQPAAPYVLENTTNPVPPNLASLLAFFPQRLVTPSLPTSASVGSSLPNTADNSDAGGNGGGKNCSSATGSEPEQTARQEQDAASGSAPSSGGAFVTSHFHPNNSGTTNANNRAQAAAMANFLQQQQQQQYHNMATAVGVQMTTPVGASPFASSGVPVAPISNVQSESNPTGVLQTLSAYNTAGLPPQANMHADFAPSTLNPTDGAAPRGDHS